jgi:hypothetical protein
MGIVQGALQAIKDITNPGQILPLPYEYVAKI